MARNAHCAALRCATSDIPPILGVVTLNRDDTQMRVVFTTKTRDETPDSSDAGADGRFRSWESRSQRCGDTLRIDDCRRRACKPACLACLVLAPRSPAIITAWPALAAHNASINAFNSPCSSEPRSFVQRGCIQPDTVKHDRKNAPHREMCSPNF